MKFESSWLKLASPPLCREGPTFLAKHISVLAQLKRFIIPPASKFWRTGSASCASNLSAIIQRAAAAALTGPQDCVAEMRQVYQHRRDLEVHLLKNLGR